MTNYYDIVCRNIAAMIDISRKSGDVKSEYRSKAYDNALQQLKVIDAIYSMDDVDHIGGKSVNAKISYIIQNNDDLSEVRQYFSHNTESKSQDEESDPDWNPELESHDEESDEESVTDFEAHDEESDNESHDEESDEESVADNEESDEESVADDEESDEESVDDDEESVADNEESDEE
jgi:hypothetical protein